MKLISAWKDSLSVFAPKNLTRFLLVTANAIKQSYKVFLQYWWWVLPLYLLVGIYSGKLYEPLNIGLPGVIYGVMIFIFFLSMRPSVDRKDFRYFINYRFHLIYYLLMMAILLFFGIFIVETDPAFVRFFKLFFFSVVFIAHCFFAMFLLDSNGTVFAALQSLYRSFKMVVYNLPFVITTFFLFTLVAVSIDFLSLFFLSLTSYILPQKFIFFGSWLFVTIFLFCLQIGITVPICFVANFYTQKVQEQYNIYFKENS